VIRNEIVDVNNFIQNYSPNYKPQVLYTLVDKRINTRFTEKRGDNYENPAPGTVVDQGLIEHPNTQGSFDFYMIAHRATIATALPVHYFVASNRTKMSREQIEQFTYHLCYNFFNFMGSIKVPAAVMYAHKIANYAHDIAIPNESLSHNLHYI
jgi:hypothetical protein